MTVLVDNSKKKIKVVRKKKAKESIFGNMAKTTFVNKDGEFIGGVNRKERANYTNNDRLSSTYDLVEEIIMNADDVFINKMLQGTSGDIDKLFDETVEEAYRILYGKGVEGKIEPTIKYMSEMSEQLEEQLRCSSLCYFSSSALSMEMNWHHMEWGWLVENFPMIAILAARDHGKSFFFSHAYPLWRMYKHDRLSKNQKINAKLGYIFSNTSPQAIDLLEIVKDSITDIDILRERLYPEFKDNWSKLGIKTKNGCRLRARGFGATVRGGHPDWIVVDDGLKDNVIYSKSQRQRNIDYFNAVILNMLVPGGQMIVVGTPFHKDDLYSIFEQSIDFAFRKYPAIDEDGNVLWESRHNKRDLEMRKRVMGNIIFTREFLVKPISDDTSMFPDKILKRSRATGFSYVQNLSACPVKFEKVVTGCDFALSASAEADYTCFATFGIDSQGNMWLLDLLHKKGIGFGEQRRELYRIWRQFRPDVMFLESNQFQQLYTEIIKTESSMPVKPFTTDRRKHSLSEGVPGLAILFENGKFRFPFNSPKDRKVTEMVYNEFRSIGWTERGISSVGSEHDDIVMAIWLARQAVLHSSGGFVFDFVDESDLGEQITLNMVT